MKRLNFMLALVGMIVGMSSPVWAQTPPPASATIANLSATAAPAAPAVPTARQKINAEKKAQRVAVRADCRAHGKQQALSRQALRDYVKSCLAAH